MSKENIPLIWEIDVEQADHVTRAVIEKTMKEIAISYTVDNESLKIAKTKALSFEL
jgi:hypothetical protein